MLRVGVGQSEAGQETTAAQEAVGRAKRSLAPGLPTLALLFCAAETDHGAVLATLELELPGVPVVGCTTASELTSDVGCSELSVSVMLFQSDSLRFGVGLGTNASTEPDQAVSQALEQARAGLGGVTEALCLILPDGRSKATPRVLELLGEQLVVGCEVFGGAAARHGAGDAQPRQFFGAEVLSDGLPLVLIGGPLHYAYSTSSSWTPVGRRNVVGQVDGNTVGTIGNEPALDFYRRYLGPHTKPAFEFPLAVHEGRSFYLRVPVGYDEETRTVTFGAPIPDGATVQITEVTGDALIEGARSSAASAASRFGPNRPHAALVFTCNARRSILGTRTPSELSALEEALPGVPLLGFYGFAEFGPPELAPATASAPHVEDMQATLPIQASTGCRLHHCSLVALLLGDGTPAPESIKLGESSEAAVSHAALLQRLERSQYDRQDQEQIQLRNAALLCPGLGQGT